MRLPLLALIVLGVTLAAGADGSPDRTRGPAGGAGRSVPPVLREPERGDTSVLDLPGPVKAPVRSRAASTGIRPIASKPTPLPMPPQLVASVPRSSPVLEAVAVRGPDYPAGFVQESGLFCQQRIGVLVSFSGRVISLGFY